MSDRLAETAAALLVGRLVRATALGGGDLSAIVRIELADGRTAVAKSGPAPRVEAVMLRAIAACGVPAPSVLAVSDDVLVLEWLQSDGRLTDAASDLGTVLSTLHRARGERFGWSEDYAFGGVRIANPLSDAWPAFWAEHRLLAHAPWLDPPLARRIEKLAAGLAQRLPSSPAASLLHGDLWFGNVLAAAGRVTGLIDPACYFGHAEVDLAMLTLFGDPGPAFAASYGALAAGHAERRPIYQLWPALVHLRLFGSGYRPLVERLLAAARV